MGTPLRQGRSPKCATLRDALDDLVDISGQWLHNADNRHDNKRLIQQSIRRILARLQKLVDASKEGEEAP
jgi:hypothetical protein